MNISKIVQDLEHYEARRTFPYDDATGKPLEKGDTLQGALTIGVGINLSDGLPDKVIDYLLHYFLEEAVAELDRNTPWWRRMSEPRQHALVQLCFNMGWSRLAKFKKMLHALEFCYYEEASRQLLLNNAEDGPSDYLLQVGDRANHIAKELRNG